jgi:hypothetical protein
LRFQSIHVPYNCWLNMIGHYSLNRNGWNLETQVVVYYDLFWKFISNSCYFKKAYFLRIIPLHPKFYKPKFLLDVKFAPNYTEMLKLTRISTTTLVACNLMTLNCLLPHTGVLTSSLLLQVAKWGQIFFVPLTPKVLWWFQAQNCLKTTLLEASYSF